MKKKKLKRVNEKSVLWVVFILLAILSIGSLFAMKSKIDFTIYEEVCENETTANCEFKYEECSVMVIDKDIKDFDAKDYIGKVGTFGLYNPVKFLGDCEYNKDIPINEDGSIDIDKEFIDNFCKIFEEEVCKQVEVEEIEFFKDITEENPNCEGAIINVKDCNINNKSDCIYYGSGCFQFEVISKEDITIEWLDENCGCENYCDNPDFKGFNCKDTPCFVWKCGDYFVERIK